MIDASCLRKLNILTSKDRPFCAFCNSLCGFSWYQKKIEEKDDYGDEEMLAEENPITPTE